MAIVWEGRPARAWLPEPLMNLPTLQEDSVTVRLTERAAGTITRVGDRMPLGWEPMAHLLLRAEGMASSHIEGLRAPVDTVAAAELSGSSGVAGWVAGNLLVVRLALKEPSVPLEIDALHAWHRRLMRHSHLPHDLIGAFRRSQGWIGGRSPVDAVFVPPPESYVTDLMADLVVYANRTDLDAVSQAAIVHAQFETIHPYGDGNGRIGRLLVLWVLARRLHVAVPPPVSTMIVRDIGGYLSGLHWFRSGEQDRWIRWFAQTVEQSANGALQWIGELEAVLSRWQAISSGLRSDAAGRRLLELLPAFPVISAPVAARELDVSVTAARTALETLAKLGIVHPYIAPASGVGRPTRLWAARELIELLTRWGV